MDYSEEKDEGTGAEAEDTQSESSESLSSEGIAAMQGYEDEVDPAADGGSVQDASDADPGTGDPAAVTDQAADQEPSADARQLPFDRSEEDDLILRDNESQMDELRDFAEEMREKENDAAAAEAMKEFDRLSKENMEIIEKRYKSA